MNRWLLTYLVVFCSSFVITGHAAPASCSFLHSAQPAAEPVFSLVKKGRLLSETLPAQQPGESFVRHTQVVSTCPVIYLLANIENKELETVTNYQAGKRKTTGIERVLKDYLLHLFPSHYFW